MVKKGKGDGNGRATGGGEREAGGAAPGRLDLPPADDQARECQEMNLVTLREVFAARKILTRKEARGAALVFRGVSGQLRALEYGQRE